MSIRFGVLVLFLSYLTSSCSGSRTLSQPSQTDSEEITGRSLLLINYEFQSNHSIGRETGCKLRVLHPATDETFEIHLDPKFNYALVEAPSPGEYETSSLYCGLGRVWTIPKSFDAYRFRIVPSKINYLGMYSLRLSREATELKMGYHYDRDHSTLVKTVQQLGSQVRGNLVSGYTGAIISDGILSTPKSQVFPSVKVRGERKVVDSLSDSPDLTRCVQVEKRSNPLFFGKLTFSAKYEGNRAQKIETTQADHLYSEGFSKCVQKDLAAFRPGVKEPVEYSVEF